MICPVGGTVPYHGAYFMKNLPGIILYLSTKKRLIFLTTLRLLVD